MGKVERKDRWIVPQACLRLKFWQVARASSRSVTTPFADKRSASIFSITEISKRMGLNPSDYANFESGETHAHPRDIVAFCKVVDCHPLDLYKPEAGPKTALPDEIFYALVLTIEDPSLHPDYKQLSWNRLKLEEERARARINEYWMEIKPLFLSLGYQANHRTTNIPLLVRSPDARQFMDRALVEYELLLEERLDSQQKELNLNLKHHHSLSHKNDELKLTAVDTFKKLRNFVQWRDTPQTFALLDWYEHYCAVKDISNKIVRAPKNPGPQTLPEV